MNSKSVLCNSCQHNMKNTSCGACADKTIQTMKHIDSVVQLTSSTEDVNYFIYSCKIGVNDPNSLNELDPFKCKYYFSTAFKLHYSILPK
jgi:hypothetical protein